MLKKKVSVILAVTVMSCSIFGMDTVNVNASSRSSYSITGFFKKIKEKFDSSNKEEETTKEEVTTEEVTTEEIIDSIQEETTQEIVDNNKENEEVTTKTEIAEETSSSDIKNEEETTTGTVKEEGNDSNADINNTDSIVSEESDTNSQKADYTKIYNNISYYKNMANGEAKWLWNQQLSNGAFAFYNADNGAVYINPYFSEIVAISLIKYDSNAESGVKIRQYLDWHFAHINTAESDYNGLKGTIYDYDVVVENGIVISESSRGSYDSTDSYSALFIKVLADYAKTYGDISYLQEHKELIKDITNVMFATMSGGYTYAKPDYNIIYLMDNAEVYAGLKSAKYIYSNVIKDDEMYKKVSEAVDFYDNNFNSHWWKGDHYATVLNPDYSEYTGYTFSWNDLYPCATSQIFPILYGVIDAGTSYSKVIYEGLCSAWEWEDMDYISKGATVFCWGNFAYLGGLMNDEEKLNSYMNKYNEIVDSGRPYPLYSSESAMVLLGCDEMIKQLESIIN